MIELYTGTPGSGKSYHSVNTVLEWLSSGKTVISNFPIAIPDKKRYKRGKFIYMQNITVDFLEEYALNNFKEGKEGQGLILFDEAQIKFNCRDFRSSDRIEWLTFFSIHRHMCYDVLLVTQYDRNLDRQIRVLIEFETKHRKLNNAKWFKFIPFTVFCYIRFWYCVRTKESMRFVILRKRVSKFYNTFSIFKKGGVVDEAKSK